MARSADLSPFLDRASFDVANRTNALLLQAQQQPGADVLQTLTMQLAKLSGGVALVNVALNQQVGGARATLRNR